MLFDSDLDEDDIEVLKECLEKAKKPKKSNKMSQVNSNNSKGLVESNCIDVLPFQNEKPKPRKRKLENAEEFNHSPEKSKKRKLNYRLERLIKVKSRRTTVPEDPKLSPLYSEKEMKWNRFEIDKKIQSEEDDDSGIESVKSSTSTCTTDNVQTCNTNSIQYNNKIKGNCEICLQKISYSCTCLVQNSQDSKKIQQDCDIEINTTSIVSNPSHIGFPSRYKIPPPDLIVALDCEFVGVHPKNTSALGRCSIVNFDGNVIFDVFVRPDATIVDYRTRWSGIRKRNMRDAIPFQLAQQQIRDILQGKIVVGHAVFNDFKVMQIQHEGKYIRDTSGYKPLRALASKSVTTPMSLKNLAQVLLGRNIQQNEHCSVEDSRATLDLYKLVRTDWEQKILEKEIRCQTNNNSDMIDNCEVNLNCNHGNDNKNEVNSTSYLSDEFWPQYLFS